jgi:hypothetical protein
MEYELVGIWIKIHLNLKIIFSAFVAESTALTGSRRKTVTSILTNGAGTNENGGLLIYLYMSILVIN